MQYSFAMGFFLGSHMQFHMAFSKAPVDLVHKKFKLPQDKLSKFVNSFIEFGADRTCIIYLMKCFHAAMKKSQRQIVIIPNQISLCLPFC